MVVLHPTLFSLLRSYGTISNPKYLVFPTTLGLSFRTVHDFFVNDLLCDEHFQAYPPSSDFQRTWWKWVLIGLEDMVRGADDEEVSTRAAIYLSSVITDRFGALDRCQAIRSCHFSADHNRRVRPDYIQAFPREYQHVLRKAPATPFFPRQRRRIHPM